MCVSNVLKKPMLPIDLTELLKFLSENMTCNVRKQLQT